MRTCYIFGAAEGFPDHFVKKEEDLILAADAGLLWLERKGIAPDLAVGDFDSAGFVPTGCEVIRYPVKKDDTDSMLAVKAAFERGYSHFVLYGCYGKRPDHTFSNYQLLAYIANRGGTAVMNCGDFCATAIRNGYIAFSQKAKGNFSAFSLVPHSKGLSITGALYELQEGALDFDSSLGQSNAFIGKSAHISVSNGTILIFWQGNETLVEEQKNKSKFVKEDSIYS